MEVVLGFVASDLSTQSHVFDLEQHTILIFDQDPWESKAKEIDMSRQSRGEVRLWLL